MLFRLDPQRRRTTAVVIPPSAAAALLAVGFLVAHLLLLPKTPTGVDAVNFVLGVRDFDVADHRPHAPGYPVFIALGKTSAAALESVGAFAVEPRRLATVAVAVWSTLFGTIAVFGLRRLFKELDADDGRAMAATVLTISCPLFWFNSARAMSDVAGLAAAVVVQALTISSWHRSRAGDPAALKQLLATAFITGLATGLRSQVAWLALPLLTFVVIDHARRAGSRMVGLALAALMAGGLLWAVPLMFDGEGPGAYLGAIASQARDDVASGRMQIANPAAHAGFDALVRMMSYPWANKYLAASILGLASIGAGALLITARSTILLLMLGFGPYAIYHLLFQDATFTRYALPLVPLVAFLAVRGLNSFARTWRAWIVTGLAAASLALALPPALALAQSGSPSFRALDDIRARLPQTDPRPVLAMHHAVSRVLRLEPPLGPTLAAPARREWLELVKYWRDGGEAPLWFLAEPERTDLALIDPRARRLVNSYRLPVDRRFFLSGVRPSGIDWYELDRPGWFVAAGWALTPETAGENTASAQGPSYAPVSAYVRRRAESAVMVIGGRHLQANAAPARFELSVDGKAIDEWEVPPAPGSFLRIAPLEVKHDAETAIDPAAVNPHYALIQVRSVAADGSTTHIPTSIEQFDIQSADRVVFGFADGWFEQEYDEQAVQLWRWMGPWAVIRIHNGGHDVTLRMSGDAPTSWLGGAATVVVRAGDEMLGRFVVSDRFHLRLPIPADILNRSHGRLTLESDRGFVPEATLGTSDRRTLALRVSQLQIDADVRSAPRNRR